MGGEGYMVARKSGTPTPPLAGGFQTL